MLIKWFSTIGSRLVGHKEEGNDGCTNVLFEEGQGGSTHVDSINRPQRPKIITDMLGCVYNIVINTRKTTDATEWNCFAPIQQQSGEFRHVFDQLFWRTRIYCVDGKLPCIRRSFVHPLTIRDDVNERVWTRQRLRSFASSIRQSMDGFVVASIMDEFPIYMVSFTCTDHKKSSACLNQQSSPRLPLMMTVSLSHSWQPESQGIPIVHECVCCIHITMIVLSRILPLYSLLLVFWSSELPLSQGFSVHQAHYRQGLVSPSKNHYAEGAVVSTTQASPYQSSSTALGMYNLPPSGGGNRNNNNDNGVSEILTWAATILGVVAFFASPLGGLFFSIVNSIVVLSILTPVVIVVGFQAWTYFNTLEGPCPNCGAPVRVVKESNDSPSICLNCGAFVQATEDKNGIDFYYSNNGPMVVDEDYQASFLDTLFGGGTGRAPLSSRGPQTPSPQERQSQYQRETTIIDVEVEDQ